MSLHPQSQAMLDLLAAAPPTIADDEHLDELRGGLELLLASGAGTVPDVHAVDDHEAPGRAGGVRVRVYRPTAEAGRPVVVFLHGGGWTLGSVDGYDALARQLAAASRCVVASVDYRLAPEAPFPAALDDAWAALEWVAANAEALGGDPARLALAGDSAGGNLAAVLALLARDAGGPDLALQVLVYPVIDSGCATESYSENGTGYLLEAAQMRWFYDCYLRGTGDPADWRVSPMQAADLRGVAPALVITAEYDPLRDEGEAYAERLAAAGVAVEQHRYDGMLHAFFGVPGMFDAARDAHARVATALRRAFGESGE